MAIDEFRYRGKYVCVLYDLDNNQIFDMIRDKDDADSMDAYFTLLRGRAAVIVVTIDRSSQFRALIPKYFPNATIVADHFHIGRDILDAFKRIRQKIERSLTGDNEKEFRADRYPLFAASEDLSTGEEQRVTSWTRSETELGEAYRTKETLFSIWKIAQNSVHGSKLYESWKATLSDRQVRNFQSLINSIDAWADPIFAFFDFRSTSSIAESLNRLSRERVRKARGCSYELLRCVMTYPRVLRQARELMTGKSVPVSEQVPIAELLNRFNLEQLQKKPRTKG